MSKIADSIRRGLEQAVAYAEGNANESGLSHPRVGAAQKTMQAA